MRRFLAGCNLVKINKLGIYFYGPRDAPLGIFHYNISFISHQSKGIYYFSKMPKFGLGTYYETFWPFLYQNLHNFYSIFRVSKVAKRRKYDVVYYTLCRAYRDPDGPSNENEPSKTYKEVIREHEGE